MTGEAAGFWRRFVAALIDGILLGILNGILRALLGMGAGTGLGVVVSFTYFTYFHGRTGQTPGNAALSIRVVDIETGEVIGYGRAFGRALMAIVSTVVLLLGFLWMLWDSRKQTWHDKVVGSIPVRV
jgi:uncharacterized RDD family membrane protein YckC